jgi:hypothetical protein
MTTSTAGKGIESAIKHLLTDEYKFLGGERVQEMLAKDMIHLFRQYTRDAWNLEVDRHFGLLSTRMRSQAQLKLSQR